NRRTLEALIRGGAFDSIEPNRAMLMANIDLAMENADQKAANANQGGLFDMMDDVIEPVKLAPAPAWSESEKLAEEKTVIGFYLSGHPFAPYEQEIRRFAPVSLGRLKTQDSVRVAGFATGVRTMNGKSGRFAIVQLEDRSGFAEVSVSGELLEEARERLKADQILIAECRVSRSDYNGGELRIRANSIMTLPQAREKFARSLTLTATPEADIPALAALLAAARKHNGGIPLRLRYRNGGASGEIDLQNQWQIEARAELFEQLQSLLGEYGVSVGW
ncbi:OB-fold nucleic acid binding domain-containing protein, partial [Neisseria bacilliformis]